VTLPPLRQRPGDIRQLAEYCIDRYCMAHNIQAKRCFPELFELLEAYSWPGNVRELMNAMEQALAVAHHEPFLFSQHLPDNIRAMVMRSNAIFDWSQPQTVICSRWQTAAHFDPICFFVCEILS